MEEKENKGFMKKILDKMDKNLEKRCSCCEECSKKE